MNKFYSKIDFLYLGVISALGLITLALIFNALEDFDIFQILLAVEMLLTFVFAILFTYPCVYIFTEYKLVIKFGIFTYAKIPYANISDFTKSNSPIAAPALSLDRILINFNKLQLVYGIKFLKTRNVLVSPKYEKDFLERLIEETRKK